MKMLLMFFFLQPIVFFICYYCLFSALSYFAYRHVNVFFIVVFFPPNVFNLIFFTPHIKILFAFHFAHSQLITIVECVSFGSMITLHPPYFLSLTLLMHFFTLAKCMSRCVSLSRRTRLAPM